MILPKGYSAVASSITDTLGPLKEKITQGAVIVTPRHPEGRDCRFFHVWIRQGLRCIGCQIISTNKADK
ncbi:hypothetical protein SKAU_G00218470 [Synaphobranchus kaupii]|uniref:Uncharacterized protein n=1 Tax=Synaphobranchus kaupii TaxID=118154 RepID=A0A9Q1FAE3_SYNKA|nr:hypothetical protein SKAU_G00218470 [Synaphobranchus kaupii]